MENSTFGPGATILSIAIAAGWVAIGAMILRGVMLGIKALLSKSDEEDN